MSAEERLSPKTFYLNEEHELSRDEKEIGGRVPQYTDVDWRVKGTTISDSLRSASSKIQASHDPLKSSRYFLLAQPEERLAKSSKDKTKAKDGKIYEATAFAQKHSRVFKRLGMDLVGVTDSGSAVVHLKPEVLTQLTNTAEALDNLGLREKSRWATISRFDLVPIQAKIDLDWLHSMKPATVEEGIIELQPLLTRSEIESIFRAIIATFKPTSGERPVGTGSDYSGRQWLRSKLSPESLQRIANDFYSIQSLHPPLISFASGTQVSGGPMAVSRTGPIDLTRLPVVGVLDTGVPADHAILGQYRRGAFVGPYSTPTAADSHGTFVSSRIVFGDPDYSEGPPNRTPDGELRFYDINIGGLNPKEIDGKSVAGALQAVVSTAPDVRVFNMSFDSEPLDLMAAVKRNESLLLVQDLDNFIFQNDILVVVAAGNSPPGVLPSENYPRNFADPQWALGSWARSFNSLTCGSYVARLTPGGLTTEIGWPSPFCRVGPGLCDSPKPDFSANGGNVTAEYQYAPQLGVWGLSPNALWEDRSGSSFASPLLARQCAVALDILQKVCDRGAQPFGVTAKAFLALTAVPSELPSPVTELALRTLGRGKASATRLDAPIAETGVMIWQGVLEDDKDIAKVMVPIPREWLKEASQPRLRLVVAWDPLVNAAVRDYWATRRVAPHLKRAPSASAQRPLRAEHAETYPLLERRFDLKKMPTDFSEDDSEDTWLIELSYEQIGEYHPAMVFPPQQRVAFVAELYDEGSAAVSPQRALQALPISKSMTRLSVPPVVARTPVVLRTLV